MSPGSDTVATAGLFPVLLILLLAAASAAFLGRLYREVLSRPSGGDLRVAFPLLAVAFTALFLTVQLSLPLSMGLLAALTVIRFRTPVKEPEEIAFVTAIVSVAATLATMRLMLAGALLGAAVLAGLATRMLRERYRTVRGLLVVSLPAGGLEHGTLPGVGHGECRLQSVSFAGTEAVLSYRFATRSESRIRDVERDLIRRLPLARASVVVDAPEALE